MFSAVPSSCAWVFFFFCISSAVSLTNTAGGSAALASSDRKLVAVPCALGRVGRSGFLSTSVPLHLQTTTALPPIPVPCKAPAVATLVPQGHSGENLALGNKWGLFSETRSLGCALRQQGRSGQDGSGRAGFICSDEYCTASQWASLTCRAPSSG